VEPTHVEGTQGGHPGPGESGRCDCPPPSPGQLVDHRALTQEVERVHDGNEPVHFEEGTMDKHEKKRMRRKALWVAEALGIVLAYFGAFGLLMYPVLDAAGYLA